MKNITFTLLILLASISVNAQYKADPRAFGDKAFNNKDYYEAAYYYKEAAQGLSLIKVQAIPYHSAGKKAVKGKPADRAYITYMLAESYRLYENYIEAEGWYYKVLNENYEAQYPLARLWYGVCLRANQHFDPAITALQQFNTAYNGDEKYKAIAAKEIRNCTFAKEQYLYPLLVDIKKMDGKWNSDGSDYSLIRRDGNAYFTSSRFVKDEKKHINRIYTVNKEKAETPVLIEFKNDEKREDLEYGTPALSENSNRMYLTRWYKKGSKTVHGIYYSGYNNGEWSTPQMLNNYVNVDGFNAIQPFVTADGKQLYFVSNKPGGQGGDDIWVSDLDDTGMPVNSKNLGDVINTPLDEEAPRYDLQNKKLIYSSKGFIGLGGFDFFESFYDGFKWTTPKNLGYPINSAKDDLYYLPDQAMSDKFYISSDRESDCCLNLFEAVYKNYILAGKVVDCDTQKPLDSVKVSFIDSLSKDTLGKLMVDNSGRYSFPVTTKRPYNLKFEKAGYFAKVVPVPMSGNRSNDTLYNPDICLQAFKINKPIVIENILYDYNKATLRPLSKQVLNGLVKIMLDNPKIRVELGSHTDSIGGDKFNMKLSQARAQACVTYIISKGIDDKRIYAKGYGKRKPVAPNSLPDGKDNPEGRQLNRRTEFTVLKID